MFLARSCLETIHSLFSLNKYCVLVPCGRGYFFSPSAPLPLCSSAPQLPQLPQLPQPFNSLLTQPLMTTPSDTKEINQSLGQSPRFGPFSGKQFVILGTIFCAVFGVLFLIFGVDAPSSLLPAAWLSITCAVLSGDTPHRYWGKWWGMLTRPTWVRGVARQTEPLKKKGLVLAASV